MCCLYVDEAEVLYVYADHGTLTAVCGVVPHTGGGALVQKALQELMSPASEAAQATAVQEVSVPTLKLILSL